MAINELTSTMYKLKGLKLMASELADKITSLENILKAEIASRNTDERCIQNSSDISNMQLF